MDLNLYLYVNILSENLFLVKQLNIRVYVIWDKKAFFTQKSYGSFSTKCLLRS